MSIDLKKLKDRIELMSKHHQIEILRILSKTNKANINENNNGSFINLTELDNEIINSLNNYISYAICFYRFTNTIFPNFCKF